MGTELVADIVVLAIFGIVGSVIALINGWIETIRAANRRQEVVHVTDRTPGQIVAAARSARFGLYTLSGLIAVGLWMLYAYYDLNGAMSLLRALLELTIQLIALLIRVLEALQALLSSLQ